MSCVIAIKAGCVQGSVLCPTLFNIYVSELGEILESSKVVSYTYDSCVVVIADVR